MIGKHFFRRIRHIVFDGYDCCEMASLSYHMAKIMFPKLKKFRELDRCSHPYLLTPEKWDRYLDDMLYALESEINYDDDFPDRKRIERGWRLFGKYFSNLWI